MSTGDPVDSKL